jgi:hypothetical protein
LQAFRVLVRKSDTANPTVDIALYEAGSFVATLVSGTPVTSDTGQIVTATWDAALLSDPTGADVECYVYGHSNGASQVEIGAIAWDVAQGFTGSGAGTIAALTGTGAGLRSHASTGAGTITAATGSGTGTSDATQSWTATGAGTIAATTGTGTGLKARSGTGAGVIAAATGSGTGAIAGQFYGTGNGIIVQITGTGTAKRGAKGSGTGVIAATTGSGTGTSFSTFIGAGTGVLGIVVGAGTGTRSHTGLGAGEIGIVVGAGSGGYRESRTERTVPFATGRPRTVYELGSARIAATRRETRIAADN